MACDDLDRVSSEGVDGRLEWCQRVQAAVSAYEARLIRRGEVLVERMGLRPDAAAHLTATLGVSAKQARAVVRMADTLAAVPATEVALASGQIKVGYAEVLAQRLPAEHLSSATARRLACDAAIIPMVLGGASQPLDVGRRRYRITGAQRRALVVRDGGCVWPGCDWPPGWCEAHHLDEWLRDDGPTDLDNLALLCHRHPYDLHEGGEVLGREADGGWTVRLGLPPPRTPAA